MHLALASTSVLLLTPTVYPHDISPLISLQNWKATVNFIEKKYDIKYHPMPIKAVTGLLSIVNDLLTEKISRNEAYNKMTSMSSGTHMARFATALGQLVRRLPSQPIREDFGEAELCSRFVDPFLFELFDNPDNDTYFRWTNESTDAKHMEESKERPDFCITKTCSFEWQMNLGFGEAKSAAQDHDNRVICWDLIKVAVFCKQTLDIQVMEGTLGVQVIGRTVKFYILVLPAKGLYAFLELAVIQLPDSLNSLPGFVTKAGDIIKVLDIFERICVPASDAAGTMSRRTPTLSLTQVGQIFSPSKNRKRPCPLKLRTN
ncbi:uncharacterized protein BYT42DRAFT_560097 [Radiomyces spectabilis]|uniref:uncharacterized protein n=1 Tax=Radiomyces spectabilis TaxID=64574 RepID=UPI00221E8C35|nr:uncharacterized protein BYT42DRAFT_560097 [Radiomyces spectabilis]KAI8388444.1 hypothetical protein BYT42DRAFT_560097 [Radiomyces spectabilis]